MLKLHKSLKNQKGISIVELLIAAFILALISAVTLKAFLGQKEVNNLEAQISDAQQAATFSLAEITKAVRNAGYRAGGQDYRIQPGSLGHDTLIVYCFNSSTNSIDSTRFFLAYTGGDAAHPKLMKKINDAGAEIYAEDIEDVDFIPVGSNSLTVSLTARTASIDKHLNDYRRRTVSSSILMPNAS